MVDQQVMNEEEKDVSSTWRVGAHNKKKNGKGWDLDEQWMEKEEKNVTWDVGAGSAFGRVSWCVVSNKRNGISS